MKFLKRFALPIFGFWVGALFFFPWNETKDLLTTQIQKNSGVQVQMQSFSPTLGLRLGLMKGSLFAFSATKASIRMPTGQMVMCDELLLGPRIWPIFLGQVQLSIGCISADGGRLVALVSASPFWSPSNASASVDLSDYSLENVDLRSNFQGVLSGSLDVSEIELQGKGVPNIVWDLSGKKMHTPDADFQIAKLPSLDLENLATKGNISARTIKVEKLKFGSPDTLIEGDIKYQSDVGENFAPNVGEFSGNLRIEPNAERGVLGNAISWKTVFGDGDEKGQRQFKRSFTGGIQTLLTSKYTPGATE